MLLNTRISVIDFLGLIKFDIIAICSYSVFVGFMDQYSFLSTINVPLAISAIIGTALSLLLGFRTAQAYDRWWEARNVWGAIVNDSRTLIRELQQFMPPSAAATVELKRFVERQVMWCNTLTASLRRVPFTANAQAYLDKEGIRDRNIPNALLDKHSKALARLELSDFKQVQIDTKLARLCDAMGKCERIKNTIFPRSYSLLIHVLIYVFATLLPFGLDDHFILIEVMLTVLVPLIFISIERTAIFMQDPFEGGPMDTPMNTISATIEINLHEMIGDYSIPNIPKPDTYYIL